MSHNSSTYSCSPCDHFNQEVILTREEYAAQIRIDQRQIELCKKRGELTQRMDHAFNQLVLQLRMRVFGKKHQDKHIIRYPATWWDAVKERFAPTWFRDYFPVKFLTITISLSEIYPELEPCLPDNLPYLRIAVCKQIDEFIW